MKMGKTKNGNGKSKKNGKENVTNTETVQSYNAWDADSWLFHFIVPLATVALIWGRRGLLTKILAQFDRICFPDLCSAISKKDRLLKWIRGRIVFGGNVQDFWTDGTVLCTLINTAIPGACTNPDRHWKKPAKHGQALAFKYLGISPIFTDEDFDQKLSQAMEAKLIDYLVHVQQSIGKVGVMHQNELKYTSAYVARGMGLIVGDERRTNAFYIYRNTTLVDNDNIFVSIRGPYNSYGRTSVQSFVDKNVPDRTRRNGARSTFLNTFRLNTLLINNAKAGQQTDEIPIRIEFEANRCKITYIPQCAGIYEICLITNGAHLMGSPYNVQVLKNSSGVVDRFDDVANSIDRERAKGQMVTRKRIISQTINFVDEQISYEEYENYKRSCMDKVIKDHEMLVERERRDSSLMEEFKPSTNVNQTANDDDLNGAMDSKEIGDSNNNNIVVRQLSSDELKSEIQIKKMNFLNSTLSLETECVEKSAVAETSPICDDHIEQEVESFDNGAEEHVEFSRPAVQDVKRTVEEKRNDLKKSHRLNCIRTTVVDSERAGDNNRMRILSVLDCLKKDNAYNCFTASLPNLTDNATAVDEANGRRTRSNSLDANEIYSIRTAYRERKAYWLSLLEKHKHAAPATKRKKPTGGDCDRKVKKRESVAQTMKLNNVFSYSANDVSRAKSTNVPPYTKCENVTFPSIEQRKALFSSARNINENDYYKRKVDDSSSTSSNSEAIDNHVVEREEIPIKQTVKVTIESRKKSIGGQEFAVYKEKMKERFIKAQKFFQNLEPVNKIPKTSKRQIA